MASHPAKAAGLGQQTPLPLIADDLKSPSHHNFSSRSDWRGTRSAQSTPMHSREPSAVRGRPADPSALAPTLQARRGHSGSKSPDVSAGHPAGFDAGLERRPSNPYGHHRQTSIVHGMQHSRNPSMAGSTASTSPLSPELIASLGRGGFEEAGVPNKLDQLDPHSAYQSHGMAAGHGVPGTLSTIQDNDAGETMDGSPASVVHRRMNSGGTIGRRDRSHSRSHSKPHLESKTVGEYALHHLFNSVGIKPLRARMEGCEKYSRTVLTARFSHSSLARLKVRSIRPS